METKRRRSKLLVSIAVVAAIFLLGMGAERILDRVERSVSTDSIVPSARAQEQRGLMDVPTVVERSVPAVVRIDAKKVVKVSQRIPSAFQDPFFRQFFGDDFLRRFNVPREQVERFRGSGVVISADGYILTNNHVVGGMDEVDVTLPPPDNRTFGAKLVGTDRRSEVAVLKIDAKNLPVIKLGRSADLRLGETVLAIGYPFQVGITVTQGIVSGLAKPIAERAGVIVDFIQTDAAINPGNSGGALINTNGELIGINTLIVSTTGSYAGIGFAIPIDQARSVMEDLIRHGSVAYGYLGIGYDDVTPDKTEFFGLKEAKGVIVTDVAKDSPAMKAGLKVNDVITAIDGREMEDSAELIRTVGSMRPGDKVTIDLVRSGKKMEVSATIVQRPGEAAQREEPPKEKVKPELALLNGIGLEDLNDYYRSELGLPRELEGVIVTEIDQDSPAADEGLEQGDVIFQVNLKPVADLEAFNAAIKAIKGDKVMFTVYREGERLNIVLKP